MVVCRVEVAFTLVSKVERQVQCLPAHTVASGSASRG